MGHHFLRTRFWLLRRLFWFAQQRSNLRRLLWYALSSDRLTFVDFGFKISDNLRHSKFFYRFMFAFDLNFVYYRLNHLNYLYLTVSDHNFGFGVYKYCIHYNVMCLLWYFYKSDNNLLREYRISYTLALSSLTVPLYNFCKLIFTWDLIVESIPFRVQKNIHCMKMCNCIHYNKFNDIIRILFRN